jgi:hypothetical protein
LIEEVLRIEALATERLRSGISFASVQNGSLKLLKILVEGTGAELAYPEQAGPRNRACVSDVKSPR